MRRKKEGLTAHTTCRVHRIRAPRSRKASLMEGDLNEIGSMILITILEEDQPQQKSGKQAKSKNGRLQQKDFLSILNKYPAYVISR